MPERLSVSNFAARWTSLPFGWPDGEPWDITRRAPELVAAAIPLLGAGYRRDGDVAVHRSATIEPGAVVKGPAIVGPGCLVAATAYLRGGVFLEEDCTVGPSAELKSSFVLLGSKLAHLNFAGDSILGEGVNVEAGAIIANFRNELDDRRIRIRFGGRTVETEVEKFGAIVGDGTRIGANAVIAPGAVLAPGTCVPRLALVDQHPGARPLGGPGRES